MPLPDSPEIETGLVLSDLGEEQSEAEEDFVLGEEESSLSETETDSASLSPRLVAERDARHGRQDEKRLQLDLSKHQELLIDSQKINQSIRRCLQWTEELIKEGQKALEYQVRVSDVEINPRPRVLNRLDQEDKQSKGSAPDDTTELDMEDDDDTKQKPKPRPMPLEPRLAGWSPDPQDRDSGIELPVDDG